MWTHAILNMVKISIYNLLLYYIIYITYTYIYIFYIFFIIHFSFKILENCYQQNGKRKKNKRINWLVIGY